MVVRLKKVPSSIMLPALKSLPVTALTEFVDVAVAPSMPNRMDAEITRIFVLFCLYIFIKLNIITLYLIDTFLFSDSPLLEPDE